MIDFHSHILPGLDDGARDWQESLEMARMAVEDGITEVVCTPHWVNGSFQNDRRTILDAIDAFREELRQMEVPLKLHPGAELRIEVDLPELIESARVLTINDNRRYALIEFHDEVIPPNVESLFFKLQSQDVTPIIAHPERNMVLTRFPERLFAWVQQGILLQVTAGSLAGRFGREIKRVAIGMLQHRWVHLLGTDAHSPRFRSPRLSIGYQEAVRVLGKAAADDLVKGFPSKILNGELLHPPKPLPCSIRRSSPSVFRNLLSLFTRAKGGHR